MDQLDLSLHATAHEFGLPELARRMGANHQTLINKLNPHSETHKLTFREWLAILDNTNDLRSLADVCRLFGGSFVPAERRAKPSDLLSALLAADREHGDVVRAMQEALRDGRVSPRELLSIRAEIVEARSALDDLDSFLMDDAGEWHA